MNISSLVNVLHDTDKNILYKSPNSNQVYYNDLNQC